MENVTETMARLLLHVNHQISIHDRANPHYSGAGTLPRDEISISKLLMKLWAKRGFIVLLPLVLAVIAALIWPQKS